MSEQKPLLMFDHIGIVTADIDYACTQFGRTIGATEISERFDDVLLGVSVQFIRDAGGVVYEMISPLGENSPVASAIASKTSILNQIAYRTASIGLAAADLRKLGNMPLGTPKPAKAFGAAAVQFFFSPLGFIVELIDMNPYKNGVGTRPGSGISVWRPFRPGLDKNMSKTRGECE
jgi:methylmalonyl-CoA/ethylmalonyl-CoA epimerase